MSSSPSPARLLDPYPTENCDQAREHVLEVHKAYLDLLREEPNRVAVEASVREALGPAPSETEQTEELEVSLPGPASKPGETGDDQRPDASVPEAPSQTPTPKETVIAPSSSAPTAEASIWEQPELVPLTAVAARPRAAAERNRLAKLRRDTRDGRWNWKLALFVVGPFCVWGSATLLTVVLQKRFGLLLGEGSGQLVMAVPLALILTAALVYFCRLYAANWQLVRLTKKNPRDIPYVDVVGEIRRIELYENQHGDEAIERDLDRSLATLKRSLIGAKTREEAQEDQKIFTALFGAVFLLLGAFNFLGVPRAGLEEALTALFLAVLPLVFQLAFTLKLADYMLDLPPLSDELLDPQDARATLEKNEREKRERLEREQADARRRADEMELARLAAEKSRIEAQASLDEAERKQREEEEARKKGELIKIAEDKIAVTIHSKYEQVIRDHTVLRAKRFAELQEAANKFERERGYSKAELQVLEKEHRSSKTRGFALIILSALVGLFATYPASITTNEIFDLQFQHLFHQRIALFPWLIWWIGTLLAEGVLVFAWHRVQAVEEGHNVLMNQYDENERLNGLRYRLKTFDEVVAARKSVRLFQIGGFAVLLLEFVANAYYLVTNSGANPVLAVLLAMVPFALFVVLIWPNLVNHNYQRRLHEAINFAKTLPQRSAAIPISNAPSAQARAAYEALTGGVVDPMNPNKDR